MNGWESGQLREVRRAWAMPLLLLLLLPAVSQHSAAAPPPRDLPIVVLETELGNIVIEVDTLHAPNTAANFLKYVDGGFYSGGEFHRAVRPDNEIRPEAPIQVIQARINPVRMKEAFPPIPIETTDVTGLRHLDGTVSMARDVTPNRPGPNTANYQFFICIGNQPSLNREGNRSPDHMGFAAFGRVIEGMDVVRKIQSSPTPKDTPGSTFVAQGQSLVPTIKINRAYRK
jgi:peptidyl-prolyl cis-trans isomerase A (cyclophilin A)